jgi:hypothetical protein
MVWKGAYIMGEILARALHSMETSKPVSHDLLHIFPLQWNAREEEDT